MGVRIKDAEAEHHLRRTECRAFSVSAEQDQLVLWPFAVWTGRSLSPRTSVLDYACVVYGRAVLTNWP